MSILHWFSFVLKVEHFSYYYIPFASPLNVFYTCLSILFDLSQRFAVETLIRLLKGGQRNLYDVLNKKNSLNALMSHFMTNSVPLLVQKNDKLANHMASAQCV